MTQHHSLRFLVCVWRKFHRHRLLLIPFLLIRLDVPVLQANRAPQSAVSESRSIGSDCQYVLSLQYAVGLFPAPLLAVPMRDHLKSLSKLETAAQCRFSDLRHRLPWIQRLHPSPQPVHRLTVGMHLERRWNQVRVHDGCRCSRRRSCRWTSVAVSNQEQNLDKGGMMGCVDVSARKAIYLEAEFSDNDRLLRTDTHGCNGVF